MSIRFHESFPECDETLMLSIDENAPVADRKRRYQTMAVSMKNISSNGRRVIEVTYLVSSEERKVALMFGPLYELLAVREWDV
jgi:hypothetical protein